MDEIENLFTEAAAQTGAAAEAGQAADTEPAAEQSGSGDAGQTYKAEDNASTDAGTTAAETGAETPAAESKPAAGTDGKSAESGTKPENGTAKPDAQSGKQTVTADDPEMTLKFYGKEMKLPRSQVIAMAQKGMDYDKVRRERDGLQNSREIGLISKFAAASGMDPARYMDYLEQTLAKASVQQEIEAGMPEAQAVELAQLRAAKKAEDAERQAQEQKQAAVAPYVELLREYPDLKELPPEVSERISRGETPLAAYRAYELAQLRTQLAAKTAAEKNKKTAPGSAAGVGSTEKKDPFLSGFESAFKF